MKSSQFNHIFIGPLFKEQIRLDEIDLDIHDEIIDLSNWFCMPKQILDNLIYNQDCKSKVIEKLKKLITISNLKNLINQKEIVKIANLFNRYEIKYVFLKGSAINLLGSDYARYSRDIDILVEKESLSNAYMLLKKIGYKYRDPLVSDNCEYISNSHHLPVLSNKEGALVELHHRVTHKFLFKDCPLTQSMLKQYMTVEKKGLEIHISDVNHLILHILYHAVMHHKLTMGPVFLYDIKYLKNIVDDEKILINLLKSIGLDNEYIKITKYIDDQKSDDIFGIYNKANTKLQNKRNIKDLAFLIFTKKGRLDLLQKFLRREDLYQTSKYSFSFYFILLVKLKNHFIRYLKLDGRDGRI